MNKADVLRDIITGHRLLIEERYDYGRLSTLYELRESFTKARLDPIKNFFLEYIYPPPAKRKDLDDAFGSLDNHIRHPEHLGRIVLDSAGLLFKYGRHLPKIFNAGLKALKSFRAASNIEQLLADHALEYSVEPPYDVVVIKNLMHALPPQELDNLVDRGVVLFDILFDKPLVDKILKVIDHLVKKMKARPGVYAAAEVKGMLLGREVIEKCMQLFFRFSTEEQHALVSLIEEVERDAMEDLKEMST